MVGENALDFLGKLINFKVNITLDTIVAVFKMGIRKLLLGLDPKDLESQLGELKRKTDEIERLKAQIEVLKAQAEELSRLKAEVEGLRERLTHLEKIEEKVKVLEERLKLLDHLLETEKDNRMWLRSLMKEVEEVRLELEAVKLGSAPERSPEFSLSEEEEKQLVLALIRKGAHSPSELKRLVPFGVGKLYRILEELERDGLVRKVGKKKKRKYVPAEAEG